MEGSDFKPGLEGVVAFETEIAEPDKEGNALRYRGVDIEELVGHVPYEKVWGLLVDDSFDPGMPRAENVDLPAKTNSAMADLQSATAALAGQWGLKQLIDMTDTEARDDLARLSATMISIVAQSARGQDRVADDIVSTGDTAAERFLLRWRGEADPRHVRAIDSYWVSGAEHGANASTFTGRIVASTGADCAAAMSAAVGALSGPLHGGAPTRVLKMLDEVADTGDVSQYVRDLLDRGERIMGFGHRVEVAEALEQAALEELAARHPDRVLATNVEFWSAVVLDIADIPPPLFPALFACARVAGWSAHILEQLRTGRLIRPSAKYVGPAPRSITATS
jgi:citrate synthase